MVKRLILVLIVTSAVLLLTLTVYTVISSYGQYKNDSRIVIENSKKNQLKRLKDHSDLSLYSINHQIEQEEKQIKDRLYSEINMLYDRLDSLYRKNGKGDRDSLLLLFKKETASLGKRFYAVSYKGTALIYPDNLEFEGRDISFLKDDNGKQIIIEELEAINKNKSAFVFSHWENSKKNGMVMIKKATCLMRFDPLDLYIGLSDIIPDVDKAGIAEAIRRAEYQSRKAGYGFLSIDYNGNNLVYPDGIYKERNMSDIKDLKGNYITPLILESIGKTDGLFIESSRKFENETIKDTIMYCHDIPALGAVIALETVIEISEADRAQIESLYSRALFRVLLIIFIVVSVVLIGASVLHTVYKTSEVDVTPLVDNCKQPIKQMKRLDPDKYYLPEHKNCIYAVNKLLDELEKKELAFEQLMLFDKLTGLLNEKSFYIDLERELLRYKQFKSGFSLILLDGDDFKQKTSDFDSKQGSNLLVLIKESISKEIRDIDSAARIKFDTFAVLLPRTSRLQAKLVADRIRRNIENATQLSFSAGVVSVRLGDGSVDTVDRAKRALSRAKQDGKNRTVMI
ncbi:MAG: cache domain-containing protein [Spirochaetes bacterium]|nr:cache domain-containing protein [Spirochaetota bacterium]MBN2770303.1 cache domain-containing protein [Spirochaetota bacterium]